MHNKLIRVIAKEFEISNPSINVFVTVACENNVRLLCNAKKNSLASVTILTRPCRFKANALYRWVGQIQIRVDGVAAWRSGNVVGRINEVTLRRARLVMGWLTVFGGQTTSVFHQATQANSASYPQRDGK